MISARFSKLIWTVLIVLSAFGLYIVKYRVQALQSEIAALSDQLEQEQESLHVVSAEWSYLNRPERLQQLSVKYLKLEPTASRQIGDVESVPYPTQSVASAEGQ